jgi:anti-sigma regulatory factor (Ser/Thr protein kinase)
MLYIDISHLEYEAATMYLHGQVADWCDIDMQICYPATYDQSRTLRDFVGDICEHTGVPALWRGRYILVTDELINNAIEHGSKEGDTNELRICFKRIENTISLQMIVRDTGCGDSLKTSTDMHAMDLSHTQNIFSIRGRGLYMLSRIVDSISFADHPEGGLMVQVEKVIQGDGDE